MHVANVLILLESDMAFLTELTFEVVCRCRLGMEVGPKTLQLMNDVIGPSSTCFL
jgi:hypothetical protein